MVFVVILFLYNVFVFCIGKTSTINAQSARLAAGYGSSYISSCMCMCMHALKWKCLFVNAKKRVFNSIPGP